MRFGDAAGEGALLDVVIAIFFGIVCGQAFGFGFVEQGSGDSVFFRGPVAEVGQAAALAAEREVRVLFGIGGSVADGAAMPHGINSREDAQRGTGADAHRGDGRGERFVRRVGLRVNYFYSAAGEIVVVRGFDLG